MIDDYVSFLKEFDKILDKYFEYEKEDIMCRQGCSYCCEHGDYPFSRLEIEYVMKGFFFLAPQIRKSITEKFQKITNSKDYVCPFLFDNKCSIYNYRGITCRTFGLAYLKKNTAKLPECVNLGLNFSNNFDKNTKILSREIIQENLDLPEIMHSKLAEKYSLEFGESRSLVDWFVTKQ